MPKFESGYCAVKHKGKGVTVLFFNRSSRHKGILEEWRYSSTHSLTSALDGGELPASRSGRFTPQGNAAETEPIPSRRFEVFVHRESIHVPRYETAGVASQSAPVS
jgi:hypothetical protein